MNELQIIEQRRVLGKDFRIYGNLEQPLFKADDVASWIEHSNVSVMLNSIDEEEKEIRTITTLNNSYSAWFLTEDGLYETLMQSRKPIAKEFKKQIKEILKTIRKHGGYLTTEKIEEVLNDPDTIIKLAMTLKEEKAKRSAAEALIEQQKPKVLFADSVVASHKSMLIGELAKIIKQNGYEIGQKRLFEWLRSNGFLCKMGESYNLPTQYAMERKLFEIKKSTVNAPNGNVIVTNTVKVTPHGQIYFVNKFLKEAV